MEQSGVKTGEYEHYTGNHYEVMGVAKLKSTNEEFVVLHALFGEYGLFVRPVQGFHDDIEINGKLLPRYKYLPKVVTA